MPPRRVPAAGSALWGVKFAAMRTRPAKLKPARDSDRVVAIDRVDGPEAWAPAGEKL